MAEILSFDVVEFGTPVEEEVVFWRCSSCCSTCC